MKILLYSSSFLPAIGGREFVVHYLAKTLQELGHQPRVVVSGGHWSMRKLKFEYPVHRWPTWRGYFPETINLMQLYMETTGWGCDVIHAHNTYPTGYVACRLKAFKRTPLVITPHGMDIHIVPGVGHGLRMDPEVNSKIRTALAQAEILTAISGSVEASLLDAGASQEKVRLVPNGVDIARFETHSKADVRKWLGLPPESRLIVMVGRHRSVKGQDVMVRAMPLILEKEPRAHLVIVGEKTQALLPLIRELNIADRVCLPGGINPPAMRISQGDPPAREDNEDWLAELYKSADVYVSAGISEGAEGLSLAVLEAIAAGLPMVATAISGNRDVVSDGYNGVLVPPNDSNAIAESVSHLLNEENLRLTFAENAKKVANRYRWSEIAKRYIAVYEEAIDRACH